MQNEADAEVEVNVGFEIETLLLMAIVLRCCWLKDEK